MNLKKRSENRLKITNKYIINIIVANLLWSFIPIVATGLFDDISILTIITLTLVSTNVLLVYAEAGGTGKYLTVAFSGEGTVVADKVQSGETWTFVPALFL